MGAAPPDRGPRSRQDPVIESRSIEVVPPAERHGRTWHLGTLWFMVNAQLTALTVGFMSPVVGTSFFTSITGVVAGALFSTFFMAFHSAQGPRMGLPQMIQSRAQFGFLGVLIPMALVVVMLLGFNVFNLQLFGELSEESMGASSRFGVVVCGALAIVIAALGYRAVHALERWLAYPFLLLFGVLTVVVPISHPLSGASLSPHSFSWVSFLVMFGLTTGWQLAWAPYVSDYSRYLHPSVGHTSPFVWTYAGSAIAAIWLIGLGSYLGAAFPGLSPVQAVVASGDVVFDGYGLVIAVYALIGLAAVSAINLYTAGITVLSLADSLRTLTSTRGKRLVAIASGGAVGLVCALAVPGEFLDNFHNFLLLLLYFIIPWTAINLVDYYVLRRGHYRTEDLFRRDGGCYGRWSAPGLVSYALGFAAMVPFFSVPGLYIGPVAARLRSADLSAFVGLAVAAAAYVLLSAGRHRERPANASGSTPEPEEPVAAARETLTTPAERGGAQLG